MRIERVVNRPVASNCFVVERGGRAVVVDPGEGIQVCVPVDYIVLTHEHFDHIGGVEELRVRWPEAKVVATKEVGEAIVDRKRNLSVFADGVGFVVGGVDVVVSDGDVLEWGGVEILFVVTPGHTPGSVCIRVDDALFTGDTIIHGERTVVKLPGSSRTELRASVERLRGLFEGRGLRAYCGHGESVPFDDIYFEAIL